MLPINPRHGEERGTRVNYRSVTLLTPLPQTEAFIDRSGNVNLEKLDHTHVIHL